MITVPPVITIDGPSGSGKGTLCRAIAGSLQWHFLDSGAIYRVLALAALRRNINIVSEEMLTGVAMNLNVRFLLNEGEMQVIFEEKDVTEEIRTQSISHTASLIALFPRLRKILLHYQHIFRKQPGLIADGRDVGTVVFPDACIKIFLNASLKERVYRRMLQLKKRGCNINFKSLLADMEERDKRDYNRAIAPLLPAENAWLLDSTAMTKEQLINKVMNYIKNKLVL
ncbi:(d)CMP kinase [Candidatus Pantoea carbekii]|uniref:Cytidylate kinase n=1 Tax=Candidatus Pantoea carbekii TaxID=1235990 RepID=U3U8K5_9GAMM|nr:(d)CMP kinase [Candidatus Pantoea carbekii]AKC32162.1 cytidylate kinase [Candidatus Pantoea carbekii]BAO00689.1 cytidylate kinase [Candidatus Pantoea carbekii]